LLPAIIEALRAEPILVGVQEGVQTKLPVAKATLKQKGRGLRRALRSLRGDRTAEKSMPPLPPPEGIARPAAFCFGSSAVRIDQRDTSQ
jgi:hypothetical protein